MVYSQKGQKSLALAGKTKESVDPIMLFDGWLESQTPPFRLATKRVYQFLWKRFIDWAALTKRHFSELTEQDIIRFLSDLTDINRQQRERYQLIIYRAYTELHASGLSSVNPAQPSVINDIAATSWRDSRSNQAKQFLSIEQSLAVIKALQVEGVVLHENVQSLAWPTLWKRRRNAAIIALLLGCGLKPLEVLSLTLSSVYIAADTGECRIDTGKYVSFSLSEQKSLNRTSPDASTIHAYIHDYDGKHRQLTVPEWAHVVLKLWMETLAIEAPSAESVLFPAHRNVSAGRSKQTMNPATLARVVNGWSSLHGFTGISAQKLRNSFGAMCIENGASTADLDAKMGFVSSAAGALRLATEWHQFSLTHKITP